MQRLCSRAQSTGWTCAPGWARICKHQSTRFSCNKPRLGCEATVAAANDTIAFKLERSLLALPCTGSLAFAQLCLTLQSFKIAAAQPKSSTREALVFRQSLVVHNLANLAGLACSTSSSLNHHAQCFTPWNDSVSAPGSVRVECASLCYCCCCCCCCCCHRLRTCCSNLCEITGPQAKPARLGAWHILDT
jgi:hypothetical protein